jgi:carboxylesterase type B
MKRDNPVVKTNYGMIEGIIENDVYTFKGIPYAASIEGGNEWLPPKRPKSWEDIKRALKDI